MKSIPKKQTIFALVFGAHADDVEVGAGGSIALWKKQGKKVGIIDLTKSENSTNGTAIIRAQESTQATKILGATFRQTLDFGDGILSENQPQAIAKVAELIQTWKPTIVLAPYWHDRHPDHEATSTIVSQAVFAAGRNYPNTQQKPHIVDSIFYYMLHYEFKPDVIVDITNVYKEKQKAIQTYKSQFLKIKSNQKQTLINKQTFLSYLDARARVHGHAIGTEYGEAFAIKNGAIGISDLAHIKTKHI